MTDFPLTHAVEQTASKTNTILVAESENRVTRLIDLAREAMDRREPALLDAVFAGLAGAAVDYCAKDQALWNDALRQNFDKVHGELVATFIDANPRRAAECFNRYIGHDCDGFFNVEGFASEYVLRALRRLGDTPEELAFVRTVFTRALGDFARILMTDRDTDLPQLADDTAAILTKLRAVPDYAADVDAATGVIIRSLRDSKASADHIALFGRISPTFPPSRPTMKSKRGKAASHDS